VERFTGSSECQEYKWLNLFYKYSDSRLNSKIGNGDGALTIVKMQNTHLRDEPTAMVAAANPPTARRDLGRSLSTPKCNFLFFQATPLTSHLRSKNIVLPPSQPSLPFLLSRRLFQYFLCTSTYATAVIPRRKGVPVHPRRPYCKLGIYVTM
jgi:hypothetical protein